TSVGTSERRSSASPIWHAPCSLSNSTCPRSREGTRSIFSATPVSRKFPAPPTRCRSPPADSTGSGSNRSEFAMTATPTYLVETALTAEGLAHLLPDLVSQSLAPFVLSQRWYGDKSRSLRRIEPIAHSVVPQNGAFLVLLGVAVLFADGEPVEYFVPLSVSPSEASESVAISEIHAPNARWVVTDGVPARVFRHWLWDGLARARTCAGDKFAWMATAAAADVLSAAMLAESRVSSAQQSNSSIVYGNSVILKVFRRLSPGVNLEVEIG